MSDEGGQEVREIALRVCIVDGQKALRPLPAGPHSYADPIVAIQNVPTVVTDQEAALLLERSSWIQDVGIVPISLIDFVELTSGKLDS